MSTSSTAYHQIARSSKVLSRRRQAAGCVLKSLRTRGILPKSRTNSFTHAVRSVMWPPMELMPLTCVQNPSSRDKSVRYDTTQRMRD